MFCTSCGNDLTNRRGNFCPVCGKKVRADTGAVAVKQSVASTFSISGTGSTGSVRVMVIICAALLCVAFFAAPLVSMSGQTGGFMGVNLLAFGFSITGYQFATGLHEMSVQFAGMNVPATAPDDAMPIMFILLVMPLCLLIMSFMPKPFTWLLALSVLGLLVKIGFIVLMNMALAPLRMMGLLGISIGLTGFTWGIVAGYIVMIVLCSRGRKLQQPQIYNVQIN